MKIILFLGAALAALGAQRDWRDIETGLVIPDEAYADQPYVAVTADGKWVCLLTTGPQRESAPGNRTVATVSADRGKTWSPLADANRSYSVPLKTSFGRIYAISPQRLTWSDDGGLTWTGDLSIPMRPGVGEPGAVRGWTVALPVVAGTTAWVPWAKINQPKPLGMTEVFFLASDNILTERDPTKIRWRLSPDRDHGLLAPEGTIAEEPHMVPLSDGTLYAVFRTEAGNIGHTNSRDGITWSDAVPLTYPDGRRIPNPRACPSLWKTAGGKYLLWFHNYSGKTLNERNPAWISAGVERQGRIEWSQPEVLLYSDNLTVERGRLSYPGFFEDGGRFYITTTQKTIATVHAIDAALLAGAWSPRPPTAKPALALDAPLPRATAAPKFPDLARGGFSFELRLRPGALAALGEALLDGRDERGNGVFLGVGPDRNLRFQMADTHSGFFWDSDPRTLDPARSHHAVVIVDGGPDIVSFVVDGILNDGGSSRLYGWGRFPAAMNDVNGSPDLRIGAGVQSLRIYDRYLRTFEAVALFRAERLISAPPSQRR